MYHHDYMSNYQQSRIGIQCLFITAVSTILVFAWCMVHLMESFRNRKPRLSGFAEINLVATVLNQSEKRTIEEEKLLSERVSHIETTKIMAVIVERTYP